MATSARFWIGLASGAIGAIVVAAGAAFAVVTTGAYNIAATEGHYSLARWAFSTAFHRSVERNAADIEPPSTVSQQAVEAGAGGYKEMCQHCHAGPGVDRAEWAQGMLPKPPHLTEAAAEWKPNEVFWLVKHGARMTGMPAFGPTHTDEDIWNVVAFVSELPKMTPERYASLAAEAASAEHGHGASTGHAAGTEEPRAQQQ